MKRFLGIILAMVAVFLSATPCLAWGPDTHLEIDKSLGDSNLFKQGSVFPDCALGLHVADGHLFAPCPENYAEIHNTFHSREFADILWITCQANDVQEFAEGWIAHTLGSDPIESAYSQDKVSQGAPDGADWCVDYFYCENTMDTTIGSPVRAALQSAIDQTDLDWTISADGWLDIEYVYMIYLDFGEWWYEIYEYDVVAQEWYSDHEWYLQSSIAHSTVEILSYQGSATLADVNQCTNWWQYGGYLEMSDVLKVVNLWLYPR